MKTLDGAYVVITDGDLIVTVEHNQAAYDRDLEGQVWGITGGRIDSGETEEDAARREGFEESGVIITNLIKLGTFKSKVISEGRILDNTTHLFWSQENELEKKIRKEATSEICQVKLATPCDIREMRNVFMLSSLRMILMCKCCLDQLRPTPFSDLYLKEPVEYLPWGMKDRELVVLR